MSVSSVKKTMHVGICHSATRANLRIVKYDLSINFICLHEKQKIRRIFVCFLIYVCSFP